MKLIVIALLGTLGYYAVYNELPFELPTKTVYVSQDCEIPPKCPTLPKDLYVLETIEEQFCKGELETVLMKKIKQVKVDVEKRLASN